MYDRKKDPQEMNNVFNDLAYADVVKEMETRLAELRVKYKDSKDLDQKYIDIKEKFQKEWQKSY